MAPVCVHHIEFGVLDGLKHVQKFVSQFNFRLAGKRITSGSKQWLLSSHTVRFLITELSENTTGFGNDPYVHPWTFPTEKDTQPVVDSVFNVAFRVEDIESCVDRLSKQNVQFIKPLQTVSDHAGSVRVCMIRSCVGNVVHTLVEDRNYLGLFLPGFQGSDNCEDICSDPRHNLTQETPSAIGLHHVDHVAVCTPRGSLASVISWYENCFGTRRFFVNRDDDAEEGFVISGENMALRLKAIEYSSRAENTQLDPEETSSVRFVFAEYLPHQGPDQLETFMTNHKGPGVFHLALHTSDIIGAISQLQANGVSFNEPPYTYYTEVGRLKELITVGVDIDQIRKNGILIDTETDDTIDSTDSGTEPADPSRGGSVRYLMQKFTQPLFEADTFYLEVIQRVGATGFGSGNVKALWRSLQTYLNEKEAKNSGARSDEI